MGSADLDALFESLTRPSALLELAVLAACLGAAWFVVRLLRGNVQRPASVWFGARLFDGVLFPVLALAFALTPREGYIPDFLTPPPTRPSPALEDELADMLATAPEQVRTEVRNLFPDGALPERVAASSGGSSSNLLFGGIHPETGRYYSNYHFDGMGAGGTERKDGNDAEITRHSNCRNTPIEVFEHRYPLVTVDHGLATDSGGAGRHRGGLATERTLRVTAPEITFSALFDRSRIPPTGLFGGSRARARSCW